MSIFAKGTPHTSIHGSGGSTPVRVLIGLLLGMLLLGTVAVTPAAAQVPTQLEEAILRATNAGEGDGFGQSIAISGGRAIVGTSEEEGPADGLSASGAAYVFERSTDGTWGTEDSGGFQTETQLLRASNREGGDLFGWSVAISRERTIVGVQFEDGSSNELRDSGAAYAFVLPDGQISSAPAAPTSLTATASSGQVDLDWAASDSADVARYRIYRDTAPIATSTAVPFDSVRQSTTIDFEEGVPSGWTAPSSGSNADWDVTSTTAATGMRSLQSGAIGDSQTSSVEVTITVPQDTVMSFDYKVSSESGFDYFRFFIDGAQALERSGEQAWAAFNTPLAAGTHTLRWTYSKDGSVDNGTDAAWIDNVVLPGDGRGTTYADASVLDGMTYYYRVTAVDEVGNESTFSNEADAIPGVEVVSVGEARSAALGEEVTTEGVVTRAFGSVVRIQDDTGALFIRQASGSLSSEFQANISGGTIRQGTRLRVRGALSHFNGMLQINNDDLNNYSVVEQNVPLPAPQVATFPDITGDSGEALESELVRVTGFTIDAGSDTEFQALTSYTITDGNGNTSVLRVQGSDETQLIGTSIPSGSVAYTGVLGQFNDGQGRDVNVGYQLYPVHPSDLQTVVAPTSLTATAYTDRVELNWATPSLGADRYRIYRGTATIDSTAGPDAFVPYDSTAGDTPAFTDTDVFQGRSYYYRVTAVTTDGVESAFSNEAQASPQTLVAGADQYAVAENTTLTISAPGVLENDRGPEGATLTAALVSTVSNGTLTLQNDGAFDYTSASGFTGTDRFAYEARTSSGAADTADVVIDVGDPAPDTPIELTATATTDRVSLSWTASPTSNVTIYRIYRNTASIDSLAGPGGLAALDSVSAPSTGYVDASVTQGSSYYYRLTAVDDRGAESGFSNEATATPAASPSPTSFRLAGLHPTSGAANTRVRIYGSGFDAAASGHVVRFGGVTATIDNVETGVLVARVPGTVQGPLAVSVERTSDGAVAQTAQRFTALTGGSDAFSPIGAGLVGVRLGSSAWGDYDGDRDLDLVVAGLSGNLVSAVIYENGGTGSFSSIRAGLKGAAYGASTWGDYDNDGDLDLLVTGWGEDISTTLYENEEGDFLPVGAGLTGVRSASSDWGDYDGDGDLDLVVTGETVDSVKTATIYENRGNGVFFPLDAGLVGIDFGAAEWGDYDNDGDLDLVVVGQNAEATVTATLYRNEGGSTFRMVDAGLAGIAVGDVSWGDYDNDGDLDLVVVGWNGSGDSATIYRNEGGTFIALGAGLRGVTAGSAAWGDYDGDGDLDLVLTGSDEGSDLSGRTATIYNNDGGTFAPIDANLTPVKESSSAWGDYDSDGDLDLLITGRNLDDTPTAIIYENGGIGGLPAPSALAARAATRDGLRVTLRWTSPDQTGVAGYRVYRSSSAFVNVADVRRLEDGRLSGASFVDTEDLAMGGTYYYRLVTVGADGASGPLSEQVRVTFPEASTRLQSSISFNDATDAANYRLVGLPGQVGTPVNDLLDGTPGSEGDWRAYEADGTTECGVDACAFAPGNGFWVLSRGGMSDGGSYPTVPLSEDGTFTIPLASGWNLISNPFAGTVSWAAVQSANRQALPRPIAWASGSDGRDGLFEETDRLNSARDGVAYYFDNSAGLPELILPHPTAADSVFAAGSTAQLAAKTEFAAPQAQVVLTTVVGGKRQSQLELGIAPDAAEGLDLRDAAVPPMPFRKGALRAVERADGTLRTLLRAYRPFDEQDATGRGQSFPVRLTTLHDEPVTVRMTDHALPDGIEVVLVDPRTARPTDLRRDRSTVVQSSGEEQDLIVLIGTSAYIDRKRSELLPETMVLLPNYPNPVRAATTIEYALPTDGHVRLEVYDILGRRVGQLVDAPQRAGFHRVQWRTTDARRPLASGIYFYRLQVGHAARGKKMVVVR